MIKASLENGTTIILKNGEWLCDDVELKKMLDSSQNYWRARENNGLYQSSIMQDNSAAAKVLAQFGGDVISISNEC